MTAPKLTIRTVSAGERPAAKEKFAKPLDSALPPPDRNAYTWIVSDGYLEAIEYSHAKDLWPGTTRWVGCAEALQGIERPRVIVVGAAKNISQEIVEALARKGAEVTYDTIH